MSDRNPRLTHDFLPTLYEDDSSIILTRRYDVTTCPDDIVTSSLGDVHTEEAAQKFLGLSKCYGSFVGVKREEFLRYLDKFHVDGFELDILNDKDLLRIIKSDGSKIIFPTEELLDNQKVKKR